MDRADYAAERTSIQPCQPSQELAAMSCPRHYRLTNPLATGPIGNASYNSFTCGAITQSPSSPRSKSRSGKELSTTSAPSGEIHQSITESLPLGSTRDTTYVHCCGSSATNASRT